ncbi:chaperonin 10-like protein, partial [Piptocephalis cylindrospora]
ILGLYVVGSAGDDSKVEYLKKDLGFDDAFNYKTVPDGDLTKALQKACPKGIDIYFENVGGKMLDAVLTVANRKARIVTCGMISQYNRSDNPEGNYNLMQIVAKSIRMEGFIVFNDFAHYQGDFLREVGGWLKEGKIKYRETVTDGITNAPQAFIEMLQGKNHGKAVVKVADFSNISRCSTTYILFSIKIPHIAFLPTMTVSQAPNNVENVKVIYKQIPQGIPKADQDFVIEKEALNLDTVEIPAENGVLLRSLYITVDPYMRGRMRDPKISSYCPAFIAGSPMNGDVVAEVIRSNSPNLVPGDIVLGGLPWQSYIITQDQEGSGGLINLKTARTAGHPLSYYLGVLGMPGLSGHSSLLDIGKPKAGETLFISAASGAVGQVVGQIGKILGLYVVGSAGDDSKVEYLKKDLGFDDAFNYKTVPD